jgi:quinol monooxygenase YgiN
MVRLLNSINALKMNLTKILALKMKMNLLTVKLKVKSEKRNELIQTLLSLAKPLKAKRANKNYQYYQSLTDENVFILVSEWNNRKALEDYLRSEPFSILLGTKILLSEPVEIGLDTISNREGRRAVEAIRVVA